MRRFLTIAGLVLCLGAVACDPNDPKVKAANEAVDAGSELPGYVGIAFGLIGSAMSAFGIRRANVGHRFASDGWSDAEIDELVVALKGRGYKIEKVG